MTWLDDEHFQVDGVEFTCSLERGGAPGRFFIWKPRPLVEDYVRVVEEMEPRNIVELGVAEGGSTAFLSLLARPDRLVAIDRAAQTPAILGELLEERELADAVHLYHDVDQGDRARVLEIAHREFTAGSIDLVLDDASHLLEPTRSSFEVLFPLLRPGGRYVIEDWNWEHAGADRILEMLAAMPDLPSAAEPPPLESPPPRTPIAALLTGDVIERLSPSRDRTLPLDGPFASLGTGEVLSKLVIELMLARARSGDLVRSISIGEFWIVVERGDGPADSRSFRLADTFDDSFGLLGHG